MNEGPGSPKQEETLLGPVWLKVEEVYSQNKTHTGALFEENSWCYQRCYQRIAIWETNPGRLRTIFLVFSPPSQTLAKNYARKIQLIQPYIIRRESDFEKRYYKKKKVKERNKTYCQKKKDTQKVYCHIYKNYNQKVYHYICNFNKGIMGTKEDHKMEIQELRKETR